MPITDTEKSGLVSAVKALSDAINALVPDTVVTPQPQPQPTGSLSTLAVNALRNLGSYAPPNTDAALLFVEPNILDDSAAIYDPVGKRIVLGDGGHGFYQQSSPFLFDLDPASVNYLKPRFAFAPTPQTDMTAANLDSDFGRWKSTNLPVCRHWYGLTFVAKTGLLHCLQARGMPDHVDPSVVSNVAWGGRNYRQNLDTGETVYGNICSRQDRPTAPLAAGDVLMPWEFDAQGGYDPISDCLLVIGVNLWLYDPATMSFVTGPATNFAGTAGKVVYVPEQDAFYCFTGNYATDPTTGGLTEASLDVCKVQLARNADHTIDLAHCVLTKLTEASAPTEKWSKREGFCYLPDAKKIVGLIINGVGHVFDPFALTWSTFTPQLEAPLAEASPVQSYFHCVNLDPFSGCVIWFDLPDYGTGSARTWAWRPSFNSVPGGGTGTVTPPATQPPATQPPATTAAMSASLDFGNGSVAHFSTNGATDMGTFVGEFVQQRSLMALDPAFPDWRVFFRPDVDGTRDEVVVEYGRATAGTPVNVTSPYTATITKAGAVVHTVSVPAHYWYSRWRYQSAPRPIVHAPALLKSRKWIPNFGSLGLFGATSSQSDVAWPGPMGVPARPAPSFPFDPGMAQGGDHDEIALLTEAAASYMVFPTDQTVAALTTLRTEGEWCGNWPMHIRDGAGNMLDCRDVTTGFKSNGGTINEDPTTPFSYPPGWVAVESAHWYANANGPWLLTEDPFMLEEMQFGVNWRLLYDFGPRKTTNLGGLIYPGQTRSFAWGLRDLVYLAASTPDAVPQWLLPKAHWRACLDDNLAHAMSYVNAPARIHSLFRQWTNEQITASWMSAWLTTAVGMAIEAGFAEWQPVFTWSIGLQLAMTDGASGWNRQWPAPYKATAINDPTAFKAYESSWRPAPVALDAHTCASWADMWSLYKAGGNGASDDHGHLLNDAGWDGTTLMAQSYNIAPDQYLPGNAPTYAGYAGYFCHLRAALVMGVRLGVPGARASYDYLHGQMVKQFPAYGGAGVPGKGYAGFAIDP